MGKRLHERAAAIGEERRGFFDWLGDALGRRIEELPGVIALRRYDEHTIAELIDVLRRGGRKLAEDPASRSFRERLAREHDMSIERLTDLRQSMALDEAAANDAVYDLYGIGERHRALIDAEFE